MGHRVGAHYGDVGYQSHVSFQGTQYAKYANSRMNFYLIEKKANPEDKSDDAPVADGLYNTRRIGRDRLPIYHAS